MTAEKRRQFAELVVGLSPAEWSRLVIAVEKSFAAEYAKTRLADAAAIEARIRLEEI